MLELQRQYTMRRQNGFTLLEVLVTVVVLAFGLLGLAGLHVVGQRMNDISQIRSQATILANDIMDRMRANPNGVSADGYEITIPSTAPSNDCQSSSCSATEMAELDMYEWGQLLQTYLPAGTGAITQNGDIFTITLSWTEKLAAVDNAGNRQDKTTSLQVEFRP